MEKNSKGIRGRNDVEEERTKREEWSKRNIRKDKISEAKKKGTDTQKEGGKRRKGKIKLILYF